jgi:putative transposase
LGTKRSLLVDGNGIPLALETAAANEPDMVLVADTLASLMLPRPEAPDEPENLCGDKGYDSPLCWAQVRSFGYEPHIRSRGEEARERQQHPAYKPRRWVVEVTHSWLNRFRKLLVRFEELDDSYRALLCFARAHIALHRARTF